MSEIQDKKNEILNLFFKSKDGLSWNEATELLNDLIELAQIESHNKAMKSATNAIDNIINKKRSRKTQPFKS